MREPRAILRSILRSYTVRGLVGFGVCGAAIALPGLLSAWAGEDAPVATHVLISIAAITLLLLGPAFAAALLVDGERTWRRMDTSLVFGAIFLLVFAGSGTLVFFLATSTLSGRPGDANVNLVELFVGILLGGATGLTVGFCSLFLKRHMVVASANGFLAWLIGFVAFFLSGAAAWAVLEPPPTTNPDLKSGLLEAALLCWPSAWEDFCSALVWTCSGQEWFDL